MISRVGNSKNDIAVNILNWIFIFWGNIEYLTKTKMKLINIPRVKITESANVLEGKYRASSIINGMDSKIEFKTRVLILSRTNSFGFEEYTQT